MWGELLVFVLILYLFPCFLSWCYAGGDDLKLGEYVRNIPGRALPIHISVVQGRERDYSWEEGCDEEACEPGSDEYWNAMKKRHNRRW